MAIKVNLARGTEQPERGETARKPGPSAEAMTLARRLAALPEPTMRSAVLAEKLARPAGDELVHLLDEIRYFGRRGGPPFDVALLALATVLSEELIDYQRRAELYKQAKASGLTGLVELFFSNSAERKAPRRQGPPREFTLGHRKWLARGNRREVLSKLVHDPEPEVMTNLLRNPMLVERDVVDIASRRPLDPRVLRHVFDNKRWILRYPIKRTLVLNPYTPTDLSLRLLGFLKRQDLKLVATLSTLPESVRQAAARLLVDRSPPK